MGLAPKRDHLGYAALLAAIIAAAGGAWYWSELSARRLDLVTAREHRAHEALAHAAGLRTDLLRAELGVRSYLVTRRQSFLNAYDSAAGLVPGQLRDLQAAASENVEERELVALLRPLVAAHLAGLRRFSGIKIEAPDMLAKARTEIDRSARAGEGIADVLTVIEKGGAAELAAAAGERAAVTRSSALGAALQGLSSLGVAGAIFVLLLRQARGRRAAEATAAGSEGMMALVFQSIAEGVIVADASGRALVFNPAAERMLGGRPPEADSGRWSEIKGLYRVDNKTPLHPDEMPLVRALAGQRTESLELCVRSAPANECRYVSVTGMPLLDADGSMRGGVAVFSEVTARKRADDEIRRLNRDLQTSVAEMSLANRELESFASSVSHGLRGPLRAVDGFSRLLQRKSCGEDAEQARLLAVIRTNATRMGRLMDDLLAYVDLLRRPMRSGRVDMDILARGAYEEARRAVPGAAAELLLEPMPPARGDVELLREALLNLLSNALKFSRGVSQPQVAVGTAGGNGKTVYFVRDNGVGFNMRYAHRLFGVFQRLHGSDEFEGAGVGLAIVRRIVERHGGQIWANAEEGRGATFYFTLPTADEREESHGRES